MGIISFSSQLSMSPYYTKDKEFFNHTGVIVDYIHQNYYDELRFVSDKYKNNLTLVDVANGTSKVDFFKEMIKEKEYKELISIINLNTQDISIIYAYLKIFKFLRGTRTGLNVVFNLLGYKDINDIPTTIKGFLIKEWWEYIPEKERMTFDLSLLIPYDDYVTGFTSNLVDFIRFYVYPLLKEFEVIHVFDMDSNTLTCAGFIDENVDSSEQLYPVYFYTGSFMDVVVEADTTFVPVHYIYEHDFLAPNPLIDSTPRFLDWSSINSFLWEHRFEVDVIIPRLLRKFAMDEFTWFQYSLGEKILPESGTISIQDLSNNNHDGASFLINNNSVPFPLVNNASHSFQMDISTYINLLVPTPLLTDFTIREVFKVGILYSINSLPIHSIMSGWSNGLIEFRYQVFDSYIDTIQNKIFFYIVDTTSSAVGGRKGRRYSVDYTFIDNVDYIIQIAWKLAGNICEICIDGVLQTGTWVNEGISLITEVIEINREIYIGKSLLDDYSLYGNLDNSSNLLVDLPTFDLRFRTEAEALIDANVIFG